MKFLDEAKIFVKSGDGGAGCVSFHSEKFVEFGGPDGGNGGKGGDIIFEAAGNLNTLMDYRYAQHFKAKKGDHGRGRNCSGAHAPDLVLKIPVGTQVIDEDGETVLLDFTHEGQREVFLRGGDGGFGNAHYKSATNQAPRKFTPGWPGQERDIWLRLKLIADAGLVGLPNAGKSTFLASVSAAKPKIADYPFTTLHPNLGVVRIDDGASFVIADIPGLIEGAHEGLGLGDKFLAHIERTSVILHLVDCMNDDPAEAYKTIRNELKEYGADLAKKTEIIALTKVEAIGPELAEDVAKEFEKKTKKKPYLISSVAGLGIREVLSKLYEVITEQRHPDESRDL
ncbi:MAG: GTPase ObgE [Alphaproteobacteria bacterium]|nr:GTPase ObgE [Alphaproteobacteria bacterium]